MADIGRYDPLVDYIIEQWKITVEKAEGTVGPGAIFSIAMVNYRRVIER